MEPFERILSGFELVFLAIWEEAAAVCMRLEKPGQVQLGWLCSAILSYF